MIDLSLFFSEDELWAMIEQLFKDSEIIEKAHSRYKELMAKINEEKKPFLAKQWELLEEKRKEEKKASLTVDELDDIWKGFRKVEARIREELNKKWDKENS